MSKKTTSPGTAGNAHRRVGIPLRQWQGASYDVHGRSVPSTVSGQDARDYPGIGNAIESTPRQLSDAFVARDRRATTDPRPVRTREFTRKVV